MSADTLGFEYQDHGFVITKTSSLKLAFDGEWCLWKIYDGLTLQEWVERERMNRTR